MIFVVKKSKAILLPYCQPALLYTCLWQITVLEDDLFRLLHGRQVPLGVHGALMCPDN